MKRHPYLRAYLVGIFFPTLWLIVLLGIITLAWSTPEAQAVLKKYQWERILIFTMALVPSLWGVWNMLYVAISARRKWSLGLHGAVLAVLRHPAGVLLGYFFQAVTFTHGGFTYFGQHWSYVTFSLPLLLDMVLYYFIWKYLIGFINRLLEIP